MKKLFLLTLFLFPLIIYAQTQWQDNGIPLRQAENIAWSGASATLSDGSVVLAWQDTRNDSRQIYAQRIDASGSKLWGEDGINVSNCQLKLSEPEIMPASDGNVFIAWHYCTAYNVNNFLAVQKISPAGELCWTSTGITVPVENPYAEFYLTADNSGGVYFSWKEYGFIKCKRLESDGSTAAGWDFAGNSIVSLSDYYLKEVDFANINGELVLSFLIYNNNLWNTYMQKVNPGGELQWGILGSLVVSDQVPKKYLNLLPSINGFWIGWREAGSNPGIVVYQFNEDGTPYWTSPLEIFPSDDCIYNLQFISDVSGFLYLGFYNDLDENYQIVKIGDNQNLLWGEQGIIAYSPNIYYEQYSQIEATTESKVNFICVHREFGDDDFYLHFDQFDSTGVSTLPQPLEFNQITGEICIPTTNRQNNSFNLISWVEYKSGFDEIKYQILDNNNQPTLNPTGEVIFSGISGECLNLQTVSMGDQVAFIWNNHAVGKIFLQTVDASGSALSEDGIPITVDYSILAENSTAFDDLNQNIVFCWRYSAKVFVQVIDESGNLLWGNDGTQVSTSDWEQSSPQISTQDGFTYVGWREYNGDWMDPVDYIYANKIDAAGNLQWGDSGVQLGGLPLGDWLIKIINGLYVWQSSTSPSYSVYAKLLDENGNAANGWEEDGNLISDESCFSPIDAVAVPGGYVVTWLEHNNDAYEIYGQMISETGELLWDDNGRLLANVSDSDYLEYHYDISISYFSDNVLYLIWIDYDIINYEYIICMQKIDLNGNTLWPVNGIVIGAGEHPDFTQIGDYLLVVSDYRDDYEMQNIKAKLLNSDGQELWETILCDAMHDQERPVLAKINTNNLVIGWRDNRACVFKNFQPVYSSIYAQNVYVEPSYSPDDILEAITAKLNQNYPNPFNPSTTISFELATESTEDTELVIYNLKGQRVKQLVCDQLSAGQHSVVWNGDDDNGKPISSGVYFYKLKAGNFEKTKKMLMMK